MIQVIKATKNPVASIVEHSCGVVVFEMPYLGVTRGYGEFMDLYKADPDALWVAYQPHDVVLNYDELAKAIDDCPGRHFQLSLSDQSFGSHDFLFRKGRTGWHRIPFVEVMTPVFQADFYDTIAPYMKESKSSWGLDHLWAKIYGEYPWLCCDYEMHHTEPITSPGWVIDGKTPMEEMDYINRKFLQVQ